MKYEKREGLQESVMCVTSIKKWQLRDVSCHVKKNSRVEREIKTGAVWNRHRLHSSTTTTQIDNGILVDVGAIFTEKLMSISMQCIGLSVQ